MSNSDANQFPENYPIKGCFVVTNVMVHEPKCIRIFDYPISPGYSRDLLRIPYICEADIRASLLKGTLRNKIFAGEIKIICSDIDLLQFNNDQKTFLMQAGITNGLEVSGGGGGSGITAEEHQTLRQLIHFIEIGGPGDGFASGAVREILPTGSPFPTSITWYLDSSKTTKLVEKLITYNSSEVPSIIIYNMYDTGGITIVHTITDTITYANNIFESIRTRSIV